MHDYSWLKLEDIVALKNSFPHRANKIVPGTKICCTHFQAHSDHVHKTRSEDAKYVPLADVLSLTGSSKRKPRKQSVASVAVPDSHAKMEIQKYKMAKKKLKRENKKLKKRNQRLEAQNTKLQTSMVPTVGDGIFFDFENRERKKPTSWILFHSRHQ